MNEIKVTVLMPCYNAAGYISEAISSVLNQSFTDFELLIINDGSTDNTSEIIRSFTDPRIVLLECSQQGVAAALNTGLYHSRSEYIARFDADDICNVQRLEKQYNFMLTHPEYIIVGSAADYVDDEGNFIFTHEPKAYSDEQIKQLPYQFCPFVHASVMYKKTVVEKVGYNINAHSFEDHLLWLKLQPFGKMYNMPERLLSVRLNITSLTIDERKRPAAFHTIKNKVLRTLEINNDDGFALLQIIRGQNNPKSKESAYYSLLGKKFLWNNYNPSKARANMKKAISVGHFDIRDYLLYGISYLPKNIIDNLYAVFSAGK